MLDVRTLLIGTALGESFLALALLFFWYTQKSYPGFSLWTVAGWLMALATLLFALRGLTSDLWSVWLANLLVVAANALRYEGIWHFFGVKHTKSYLVLSLVPIVIGLYIYTVLDNNMEMRTLLMACAVTPYTLATARALLRFGHHTDNIAQVMAAGHIVAGLALSGRALFWLFATPANSLLASTAINMLVVAGQNVLDIGLTLFFLMLNNQRLAQELTHSQQELEQLAATDALTGVYNRRKFLELCEAEIARARRLGRPLSLLMFDLDQLKPINDTYGHAAGDQALRTIVQIARQNVRSIDLIGRLGGDEFAILLIETDTARAEQVAERIRKATETRPIQWELAVIPLTLSVGVMELGNNTSNLEEWMRYADRILYQAQRAGRNQVAVYAMVD